MDIHVDTIEYEDVMHECNLEDPVEFRRVLRRNGFQHSPRLPIERKAADTIVRRLTGHGIDWYKYRQKVRDSTGDGPLARNSNPQLSATIEAWFNKLTAEGSQRAIRHDQLLGVVCSGGFLEGAEDSGFCVGLNAGLNVFIGDRGSGKSTILNLFGLLADSVSEQTAALVTQLLDMLTPVQHETVDIGRRVLKSLRQYGIAQYACFFIRSQRTYCYYANVSTRSYDLLEHRAGIWTPTPDIEGNVGFPVYMLRQGEVIRISETRNRFYLNSILDALYPDLYGQRKQFGQETRALLSRFEYYKPTIPRINPAKIQQFLRERSEELDRMWADIRRGTLTYQSIDLIQDYVDRYYEMIRPKRDTPIVVLLEGDESAFYYLYLGRIIGFLTRASRSLQEMQARLYETGKPEARSEDTSSLPDLYPSDNDSELLAALSADKVILERLDEQTREMDGAQAHSDSVEANPQLANEAEVFIAAIDTESTHHLRRQLRQEGREVADFLQTRLRVLRKMVSIYSQELPSWDEALSSLAHDYSALLDSRIALIEGQERKCRSATDIMNRDGLEAKIYTVGAYDVIRDHKEEEVRLSTIAALHGNLMKATPQNQLQDLFGWLDSYHSITTSLLTRLQGLQEGLESKQQDFLFMPIEVELRQGNTYRRFDQLSFGQKSGIILKLVLSATPKRMIIIDQPEDNLDANSVVNMLAPTLNRVAQERQVVIATHNSNLVMGLPTSNLVVLESRGENGRIRAKGSLRERNVIRDMMEVLEGGLSAFELKMKTYEDFIQRLSGLIDDMDIMTIESSFRRRTIDGLRNLLQPIISDRALLDFVRHELKQGDPLRIRSDIRAVAQQAGTLKGLSETPFTPLMDQIERLCKRLDSHIVHLQAAIEEIRLMDTQARPVQVCIYDLLTELREEYLAKLGQAREITIDIDGRLRGKVVYVDRDHLRLVFRNLLSNSFRATERRATAAWRTGKRDRKDLEEKIVVQLSSDLDGHLTIQFTDNGCGMIPEIHTKLYIERCSDQEGRDHGLGGIIIRKLLDMNAAGIRVVETRRSGDNLGTTQELVFTSWSETA